MTSRSILAAAAVVSMTVAVTAQTSHVTGMVDFRERLALPPTAIVYVTLEDISRADTQSMIVASTRVAGPNVPPIPFDLAFDARRINPAHRYGVRARIVDGDRLMFASAEAVPVITQGHGNQANLTLRFIAGPKPIDTAPTPAVVAPRPTPPVATRRLPPPPELRLPATFAGTLPCADCPGIRYELNLFPDDSYFLRTTYVGRNDNTPTDEIGSWVLSSDGRLVVIGRNGRRQELFGIRDGNTLRRLDAKGDPIGSRLASDLRRTSASRLIDVRLPMRGAYRHVAGAGRFTECSTGQDWAVAGEAADGLEAAYVKIGAKGEPVLVAVEGRIAPAPNAAGAGTGRTLLVDRFVEAKPGDTCAPRFAAAPLSGTDWRLTELADRAIAPGPTPGGSPSLTLSASSMQFSGSTGCNRLIGTYEVSGDAIGFASGGTMRACPGQPDTEKAFMATLERTRTYRILGRLLEFRDIEGKVIARFEATTEF
jgi:copper homeostasis protein (lipoprotein)